jgi:hypothetical protein
MKHVHNMTVIALLLALICVDDAFAGKAKKATNPAPAAGVEVEEVTTPPDEVPAPAAPVQVAENRAPARSKKGGGGSMPHCYLQEKQLGGGKCVVIAHICDQHKVQTPGMSGAWIMPLITYMGRKPAPYNEETDVIGALQWDVNGGGGRHPMNPVNGNEIATEPMDITQGNVIAIKNGGWIYSHLGLIPFYVGERPCPECVVEKTDGSGAMILLQ